MFAISSPLIVQTARFLQTQFQRYLIMHEKPPNLTDNILYMLSSHKINNFLEVVHSVVNQPTLFFT